MDTPELLTHFNRLADAPGAIPRLRRLVLDLAVRGKLVAQDVSEKPVSIPIDSKNLSTKGQVGKSAAESNHVQPANWVRSTLGHVGDWGSGSTPSRARSEYFGGSHTWLKSGELGDTIGLRGSEEKVTDEALAECSFRKNRVGDVLIAMYGATIGKLAILAEDAVTNQAVCGCTPKSFLSNRYLFIFLLSQREQFQALSEGGAQPNISKVKIVSIPILVPPLAEQHRIVAKVDELMGLLDQIEARQTAREATRRQLTTASLARLSTSDTSPDDFRDHARLLLDHLPAHTTRRDQIKQLRQTILNLAVRGRLVPQDSADEPASRLLERISETRENFSASRKPRSASEKPHSFTAMTDLPSCWAKARLCEIVRVLNGRAYKKPELLEAGTPVLRVGNLFTSDHWYFSDLKLEDDKYCDTGDLIYAWSASFGPFIWQGPRVIYHYHIWKLDIYSENDLSKKYLHLYLLHKTREIKSAGHGISMLHMTKEKMEQLVIPIPPLAEQHRIVAKVNELMALCDHLDAALDRAETSRTRLLDAELHAALQDRVAA